MSLINQMLRDLEERRAAEREPYDLQRDIRPLPQSAGRPLWPFAAGTAAVLGLALWGVSRFLPGPVDAPPPTGAQTLPVPALPVAAALPPVAADGGGNEGLRMSLGLKEVPPEPQGPAVELKPTPVAPSAPREQPSAKVTPAPALAQGIPVKETSVPSKPVVGEGSIEKTVVPASPRERAEFEFRRAQAALAAGRAEEAAELLAAALRQDASHVPARQALIRLHLEGRHGDAAEAALREGLDAVPSQIGWAMSLARLQVERNDLAAAQATLSRHAASGARSADYLGFLGHVQHRLGQYRDAVTSYQGAIRLAPAEGRWWLGLGLAQEADGHGSEARDSFRRALATGNLAADLAAVVEQRLR